MKASAEMRAAARGASFAGRLSHSEFTLSVATGLACAAMLGWFLVGSAPEAPAHPPAPSSAVGSAPAPSPAPDAARMPPPAALAPTPPAAVPAHPPAAGLDALGGIALAARFDEFVARVRAGDAPLALALAGRLDLCAHADATLAGGVQEASMQHLNHQIVGGLAELQRERCVGLTDAHRAMAPTLVRLAAQAGNVDARLQVARQVLDRMALPSPDGAGVPGDHRPEPAAPVLGELQDLLASGRHPPAAAMLSELYARGRGVPRDMRQALVYEIAALRLDGQQAEGRLQEHPSLSAWPPEDRQGILDESSRVLESGARAP